jgi:hypothetical protein
MGAGIIIKVLSNVPWGQVIDAAPKVADGATKLWTTVTRRKKDESGIPPDAASAQAVLDDKLDPLQDSRADIEAISASVENLRDEMLAATALIKELADQNTVLVQRVELNRRRLLRIAYAGTVVGAILLAGLIYLFIQK